MIIAWSRWKVEIKLNLSVDPHKMEIFISRFKTQHFWLQVFKLGWIHTVLVFCFSIHPVGCILYSEYTIIKCLLSILYSVFGIHHYQVLLIHPIFCIWNTPFQVLCIHPVFCIRNTPFIKCFVFILYRVFVIHHFKCFLSFHYRVFGIHQELCIGPVSCIQNKPSIKWLVSALYSEHTIYQVLCIRPVSCIWNTPFIKCFVSILYSLFGIHHLSSALY